MSIHARLISLLALLCCTLAQAQVSTVVLQQENFPVADSAPLSAAALQQGFDQARVVDVAQLDSALKDPATHLLVLPYGSAYPEASWPAILRYLDRGGNLIVFGGKPFTRAAYQENGQWKLRPESVAASLELFIADYQQTPGSANLRNQANPDLYPQLPTFPWKRAFSPVIRLSAVPMLPNEIGSTGSQDAALTTLVWGSSDNHKLAAPAILIDHLQTRFKGGRWILLPCDPEPAAFDNPKLLATLQALALRSQDRFTLRPKLPLFLPGEPLDFRFDFADKSKPQSGDSVKLTIHAERGAPLLTLTVDPAQPIVLPPAAADGQGLHTVDATLLRNGIPLWTDHTAFWLRDLDYLRSGPKLTAGPDYFQLDGQPLPVVGTTYMGSDVNRMYLSQPNPYIWSRDMAQIRSEGINMIRTGIWSGWSLLTQPDGTPTEATLRAIEALFMTARRNGLPVQFNLFAFNPDSLGGAHPYLDPVALAAQDRYVHTIADRFHDLPFVAWDLINEPTANKNYWRTLPQNDKFEQTLWKSWLQTRYPDQAALLAAWREPSLGIGRDLQANPSAITPETAPQDPFALPTFGAFEPDAVRSGANPLKNYDYTLFTQDFFADWARRQRQTIRATGSTQLITIGQDEGGIAGRICPAFYGPQIDFTSDHTWWDYDAILWASLAAKLPGKPMLIQEMGSQRRMTLDDRLRLTPEEEGWQLERKLALSFAQGAGGIEWVWNVNATMANDNETPIGAVRPDGTEKPEARVLAGFARFAAQASAQFTQIEPPQVTLVTSQAFLYSGLGTFALAAQKQALRALTYIDRTPARILPENQLAGLGNPKLVILAAPQAFTESAWQQLLNYVQQGGTLLVSGPVNRDEHWQFIDRTSPLQLTAELKPLALRQSSLQLPDAAQPTSVEFPAAVQQSPLETIRFANHSSVQTISHGQGKILLSADPVEFAESNQPAARLYAYALKVAGVIPAFREIQPLSPGVLAFPTVLPHAILYSFSNESSTDQPINIADTLTGAMLRFNLQAQRGAVVLMDRSNGKILTSYGKRSPEPTE